MFSVNTSGVRIAQRNDALPLCVCVRVCACACVCWTLVLSPSQISQTPMHMCIETIYKALCNLPFYCALGFICRGLLYHFFLCGIGNRGRDIQNGGKRKTNCTVISAEKGAAERGSPHGPSIFFFLFFPGLENPIILHVWCLKANGVY